MARSKYAMRRDNNEPEIIEALRAVGAEVLALDFVDLLVYYKNDLYMLEVKMPKGKQTAKQVKEHPKWPIHTVRDVSMALLAIGAIAA